MSKLILLTIFLVSSLTLQARSTTHKCDFNEVLKGKVLKGGLKVTSTSDLKKHTANYWINNKKLVTKTKNVKGVDYENNSQKLVSFSENESFVTVLNYFDIDVSKVKRVKIFDVDPTNDGSAFHYYLVTTDTTQKSFLIIGWGGLVSCK
ncbi:hypothetical protein N9O57_00230 [bacterium]|nr:hypothetical protein [bacterium]